MDESVMTPGVPVGRRVILGVMTLGASGVLFGNGVSRWLERLLEPITAKDGTGLASILPVGRFRIYSVTPMLPHRTKAEYRLDIKGLVDRPVTLTYEQLLALPPKHLTKDFQCVTGWRVHDVKWKGVLLADLLDICGVQTAAKALYFTSFDGAYTESLTLEQARRDDVIVAYKLEGKDISRSQGGPVRLYVAPMYGYKSIKWLDTIEVVDTVRRGYWEERGYEVDAWIGASNGRRDEPV